MTTVPLAFYWGDDELSAARALDRFEATLSAEAGAPLERWLVRGTGTARAASWPTSTNGSRRRSCSVAGPWRWSSTRAP